LDRLRRPAAPRRIQRIAWGTSIRKKRGSIVEVVDAERAELWKRPTGLQLLRRANVLHTVTKSPFSAIAGFLLKFAAAALLLIEDGSAGLKDEREARSKGPEALHVLALTQRPGFTATRDQGINVVDYAGFVDLAAECDKVQAWLYFNHEEPSGYRSQR
jgi:tRNA 2-thiouridine synthesizing protein B